MCPRTVRMGGTAVPSSFSYMVTHKMQLEEDDLVVAGSDGFFDNLNVPRDVATGVNNPEGTKSKLEELCNDAVKAVGAMSECEVVGQHMYEYSTNLMHRIVNPVHATRFTQHKTRSTLSTPLAANGWTEKLDDLTLWVARVSMCKNPDKKELVEKSLPNHVLHPFPVGKNGRKRHFAFKDL